MSMKREEEAGNARDAHQARRGVEVPLDKLADVANFPSQVDSPHLDICCPRVTFLQLLWCLSASALNL